MPSFQIVLVSLAVFAGMLCFMELGRWLGRSRVAKLPDSSGASFLALEGSVFGLMGLLIAFTFSSAASRYDMRRDLVIEETNAIGTAWKRVDLLPDARQNALREAFRQYVDSRLAFYQSVADPKAQAAAISRTKTLQDQIWSDSLAGCAEVSSPATATLVLSSLNSMIDVATTRMAVVQIHLPWLIRSFLIVLPLICSLLAGLDASAAPRSWVRTIGFALMLALSVFVILDLDSPRVGLIRIDTFDQALIELRGSMQ